jgi:CHAT domain-containing protein
VADVVEALPRATVAHIACHAHQDRENALDSGFLMRDGMLTLSALLGLRLDRSRLAILNACETARGDVDRPDQAIHLSTAMLFAGFGSVVGTMWSVILPLIHVLVLAHLNMLWQVHG